TMGRIDPTRSSATIGKPIANTRIYVLDRNQHPVPIGVPGELYIGGDGVADGYWDRPDLTAERFIPDPFSNDTESRLYRTGDLVRHAADGNLEFLRRIDSQIKIRGFRVELGEIESVLHQHPRIRSAAVALRGDSPSEMQLVAYVVSRDSNAIAEAD